MPHAGKGSPPREGGKHQPQKLSSDTISAQYSLKVKRKAATELTSPSWRDNPPLISASPLQALQTKPDFSFPSPCPSNPQCCWHTGTRICTATRLAARSQENIPGGCCWIRSSSYGRLAGSRCYPPLTGRALLGRKAQTHPERCLCSAAQPVQRQHPQPAQGAAVYISPCPRCRKRPGAGMGRSSAPRPAGICRQPAGWRRARARLHFPAGTAQDHGHLGLASDTAAVTLGRGLGAAPAAGASSALVLSG